MTKTLSPLFAGGGSCIAIARLEDGSLDEIAEIAAEFLERNQVPVGTILLLCSISHLHNVGSSIYARDWCSANAKLAARIRNAKVLPLTPILREDGPGSLSKQLIEIHTWFKRVYDKNTLGLLPVWSKLIEILGRTDEDGLDLGFSDTYTVAFQSSLLPDFPLADSTVWRLMSSSAPCSTIYSANSQLSPTPMNYSSRNRLPKSWVVRSSLNVSLVAAAVESFADNP